MPKFAIELPAELDKGFRVRITEFWGFKRDGVMRAINEVIKLWLKETSSKRSKK